MSRIPSKPLVDSTDPPIPSVRGNPLEVEQRPTIVFTVSVRREISVSQHDLHVPPDPLDAEISALVAPVRPGREHDTTALREHREILPLLTAWTDDDLRVLGDLGYEGEQATITIAFKKPKT